MTIQAFNEALERHVKLALLPQLKDPIKRFGIGMMLGAGQLRAETMLPQLAALGVAHGDPVEIDTEKLRDALLGGFAAVPTITLFGITFNKEDAEAFLKALGVAE